MKQGVNVYSTGEFVYERIRPEGDPLVLQSTNVPPDELASLGDRLTPAEGWQFRSRTLDEELTMVMSGNVRVAADELRNVYNMRSP